jgi:hypothetical protein
MVKNIASMAGQNTKSIAKAVTAPVSAGGL